MNNYEKIMLALFAIQHNAYIIQSCNDELLMSSAGKENFIRLRCEGRNTTLGECLPKLAEVMEILGELVNAMDATMGVDAKLTKIPYDIVCRRKTPEDYE